jgi:alkanesulfonate monooxygenase SsuD/methylene tetrahydromethanopterin reductase-like flavin-dependent oxidoreductase (luciferase family)/Cu/Ag efflux protein CusF
MQMPARSPACAASTAMTLQSLSGDRFLCGVGPSGPQVVEGWHGQPYGSPLVRTREYIDIMRAIIARERPLEYQGTHYRIPYDGPEATGLGKPLKSILHGKPMRFYCASITPGGMRLAGEIADGNLPIFMSPEKADLVIKPTLEGMAKAATPRALSDFDIALNPLPDTDWEKGKCAYKTLLYARAGAAVLAVPDSAVIDSGTRRIVLIDQGEGRFEPRDVKLGARGDDFVAITEGLVEGERVVVAANFLIDAESNLKAAHAGMAGGTDTPGRKQVTHSAVGTLDDVDAKSGLLLITHEPVESLKWPRMTMEFVPANESLAKQLRPGAPISNAWPPARTAAKTLPCRLNL